MYANSRNFRVLKEIWVEVTSDFRPEVEIRPFRSCAMKNIQYNPYLWPNRRNLQVIKEIEVEEHDDVYPSLLCLWALSWSHFLIDFQQNWHIRKNSQKCWRVNIAPPLSHFAPKLPSRGPEYPRKY